MISNENFVTCTNLKAYETLKRAFKKAMNPEDLSWIDEIIKSFDEMMNSRIDGNDGAEFSRKYILGEVRGFTLVDRTTDMNKIEATIGNVYFKHVIPFMGISHYPKSKTNRVLSSKLDEVMVKYIEFRGFRLGISDGNKENAENGDIVIYCS